MDKKIIKMLVMDVDGTLTDGKIYMGNHGEVCKAFHVKDGYAIKEILAPSGIVPVVITGRESEIVGNRCRELGITQYYQKIANKLSKLIDILNSLNLAFVNVAYIGDDFNDLQCMKMVLEAGGIIGCPNDAIPEIKKISNYVSIANGGNGAVRDFIEWLCDIKNEN